MLNPAHYQALNRLLTVLCRSLPRYLSYAAPWTHPGDEKALSALSLIVHDQQQMADRIAQYILQHHQLIDYGEYPIAFLDMHDLALDFLITKLVEYEKKDVAAIERCVAALAGDRHAAFLAEEALGAERGHLETLEELAGELAKAPS